MTDNFAHGQIDVLLLSGDPTSVQRARQLFLEASADYEAELLRSLRAGPYCMAQKIGDMEGLSTPGTRAGRKLAKSIKKWSAQWNLDASWCAATAHYTVCAWLKDVDKADFKRWAFPWMRTGTVIQLTPAPKVFPFEATWFDWIVERGPFIRKTEIRFKRELHKFIERTIALRKRKAFRSPVKKREQLHFTWLVQYQIGGLGFAEIRRAITSDRVEPKTGHKHRDGSKDLTPEAIQMAVTRLAKLIELKLRTT